MFVVSELPDNGTSSSADRPDHLRWRPSAAGIRARTHPGRRARCPTVRRRSRRSPPSTRAGSARRGAGFGTASRASCRRGSGLRGQRFRTLRAPSKAHDLGSSSAAGDVHCSPDTCPGSPTPAPTKSAEETPKRKAYSRSSPRPSRGGPQGGTPCGRRCGCPHPTGLQPRTRRPRSRPDRLPRAQPLPRWRAPQDRRAGSPRGPRRSARSAFVPRR